MWKAPAAGGIAYKAIAEALAPLGIIPAELIKKHTSAPTRRFQFYPPSKKNGGR